MSEDDLERRLREAFAAAARRSVDDSRPAPAPRFASEPTPRRRARLLAPLAAAAAVVAVVGGILAVARDTGSGSNGPVAGGRTSAHSAATPSAPVSSAAPFSASAPASDGETTAAQSVHIRLYNADGDVYGVGMPVVAIFNKPVADARPFVRAADVTVD